MTHNETREQRTEALMTEVLTGNHHVNDLRYWRTSARRLAFALESSSREVERLRMALKEKERL